MYDQIVERAKREHRSKGGDVYYEKHHIVPKCIGGGDSVGNLVLLTGREHYICHALILRLYPKNRKIAHAFMLMCSFSKTKGRAYNYSSRMYAEAKAVFAEYRKVEWRKVAQEYWTEERRVEASTRHSGKGNPNYGNKGSWSGEKNPMKRPDVVAKVRAIHLGKPMSEAAIKASVTSKRASGAYQKLSNRLKKQVLNLQTGEIYESRAAAAQTLKCDVTTVDEMRKRGLLTYIKQ